MTERKFNLALSFINEAPEAAAKILEQSTIDDVAQFMESIPLDQQLLVLDNLLPGYAARLCQKMGNSISAAILSDLDASTIARIIRLMPKAEAEALLQLLPRKRRESANTLLKYSIRFIGAWMQPNTRTVSSEMTVEEVLNYLQEEAEGTSAEFLYIVDREASLKGRISYLKLLKANSSTQVRDIMERDVPHVPVNMLLENALELPYWKDADTLAVTDKDIKFHGLIRHADIRFALLQGQDQQYTQSNNEDLLTGITGVYGKTLLVLFNNLMNVIEPDLKS